MNDSSATRESAYLVLEALFTVPREIGGVRTMRGIGRHGGTATLVDEAPNAIDVVHLARDENVEIV